MNDTAVAYLNEADYKLNQAMGHIGNLHILKKILDIRVTVEALIKNLEGQHGA